MSEFNEPAAVTKNYTVSLDREIHDKANEVFKALGMSFATGLTVYLVQVAQEQRIPFELKLK